MTPEQLQEKIEFIIASQATSSARMDRLETDLDQMREQHKTFRESLGHQKENIDGLMRLAQQLLQIAQIEGDARKADRQAREAELQAERERHNALEGRVDGIEEMTKFLRELLENNLRRPEKPSESEN